MAALERTGGGSDTSMGMASSSSSSSGITSHSGLVGLGQEASELAEVFDAPLVVEPSLLIVGLLRSLLFSAGVTGFPDLSCWLGEDGWPGAAGGT